MKNLRKAIVWILLLSMLSSCAGTEVNEETRAETGAQQTAAEETEPVPMEYDFAVQKADYDDETIRMHTGTHAEWEYMAEESSGDVVQNAVYERNLATEEYLRVKFEFSSLPTYTGAAEDVLNTVYNGIAAGDLPWHIVNGINVFIVKGVMNGIFLNMENVKNINLENPWWIPVKAPSGEGVYSAFTDASLTLYSDMYALFFNKGLVRDMNLSDPFAMVQDGTWTLDAFISMAEQASVDLDGNGRYTPGEDQMGYLAKHAANRAFWTSTGNTLVIYEDDTVAIKPIDDRMSQVYDTMRSFMTNANLVYVDYESDVGTLSRPFAAGNYLFMNNVLGAAETMRDSEVDFGIVPLPKKDEAQDAYYSQIATSASAYYLPVNLPDREMVGAVCETLSYYSYKDLVDVYYEVALKNKYVRAQEDQLMLDYIRDGASTDFAFAYSNLFGNETNNIINWAWEDMDLVSTYESKIGSWKAILKTLLETELPQ